MADLQQKRIPAQRVLAIKHKGAYADIGRVYRRLTSWANSHGAKPAGAALTVFHTPAAEFDPASATFEVCMPFTGDVQPGVEVTVKTVPATSVVYIVHEGPYSQIPARYTELLAWIDSAGLEIVGPPREVYVRRPSEPGADSADCVTEIQFPVNA